MKAIACGLGLDEHHFGEQFSHPTELFRIFNYPPGDETFGAASMGVGEHTDYGYITILWQDDEEKARLQVKSLTPEGDYDWIDVPSIPHTFVINLGDALEHNTGGLYR